MESYINSSNPSTFHERCHRFITGFTMSCLYFCMCPDSEGATERWDFQGISELSSLIAWLAKERDRKRKRERRRDKKYWLRENKSAGRRQRRRTSSHGNDTVHEKTFQARLIILRRSTCDVYVSRRRGALVRLVVAGTASLRAYISSLSFWENKTISRIPKWGDPARIKNRLEEAWEISHCESWRS